jgi:hypothetical protein
MRFEVFKLKGVHILVFWHVTLSSLVNGYFSGTHCLIFRMLSSFKVQLKAKIP